MPKLMWLKRNRPDLYARIGYAGDLGDWFGFQCTGSLDRSVCMLAGKWTFDPRPGFGWDRDLLRHIEMLDVLETAALPETALPIGTTLGHLTSEAASDLGLTTDCIFVVGMIDAYAGALGTLGRSLQNRPVHRLALIAGTSTCHIAAQPDRREVPGVWGLISEHCAMVMSPMKEGRILPAHCSITSWRCFQAAKNSEMFRTAPCRRRCWNASRTAIRRAIFTCFRTLSATALPSPAPAFAARSSA